MSDATFLIALLAGASALALWTFVRLPRIAPASTRGIVAHLVVAGIGANVGLPAALGAIGPIESRLTALAVLGVALPALTYLMLASLWLLQLGRQLLGGYR
jgi:hypothetical protein